MDANSAGRVVALTNQIQTIQQALEIIGAGGKITAMTLQAPTPEPEPIPVPQPVEPPEEEEPSEEDSDEPTTPMTPDVELAEPQGVDPPALTISTEDLQYPPQMLQSIRQQEVKLWREAYDELSRIGVTNVPQPPTEEPAPIEAAAPTPAPAPAPAPAAAVTTPRPQTRPLGRRK